MINGRLSFVSLFIIVFGWQSALASTKTLNLIDPARENREIPVIIISHGYGVKKYGLLIHNKHVS